MMLKLNLVVLLAAVVFSVSFAASLNSMSPEAVHARAEHMAMACHRRFDSKSYCRSQNSLARALDVF